MCALIHVYILYNLSMHQEHLYYFRVMNIVIIKLSPYIFDTLQGAKKSS